MDKFHSPDYDRAIFRVIPTVIAENLKVELGSYNEFVFRARRIKKFFEESDISIVTVFDAMSPSVLKGNLYRFWKQNGGLELSSVFPTLTTTAGLSINLGMPPEYHGIPSTNVFIREIGNYIDALRGKVVDSDIPLSAAGVDVESFLWRKSVLSLLGDDIIACDLLPFRITGGLRDFYGKYLHPLHYDGVLDAIYLLDKLIDYIIAKRRKGLILLYFSITDTFGHDHGVEMSGWDEMNDKVYEVSRKLIEIINKKSKPISLYLISDHGLIQVSKWFILDQQTLDNIKAHDVAFVGKSGRFMHIYLNEKADREEVAGYLMEILGDYCYVIETEKCAKLLWPWLEDEDSFYERLGEILVIPKKHVGIFRKKTQLEDKGLLREFIEKRYMLQGDHGGPTKEEFSALFIGYTNK